MLDFILAIIGFVFYSTLMMRVLTDGLVKYVITIACYYLLYHFDAAIPYVFLFSWMTFMTYGSVTNFPEARYQNMLTAAGFRMKYGFIFDILSRLCFFGFIISLIYKVVMYIFF